ncbi:MAG: hypothetical protein QG624_1116 [Pseudomonadota bacterium]|nr:hypothetical protein [Pseudomonadota bacterium]
MRPQKNNPNDNNLDNLMGQCEFLENSSESAFVTAHDFLKPYLGEKCIWQDKEYVLDEALIKQYLTEIFYFDYETSTDSGRTTELEWFTECFQKWIS